MKSPRMQKLKLKLKLGVKQIYLQLRYSIVLLSILPRPTLAVDEMSGVTYWEWGLKVRS